MHKPFLSLRRLLLFAVGCAVLLSLNALYAQQGRFDKLSEEDRQAFGERFEKEIWPLLTRHGENGCVGCHNGKRVTALRFQANAAKSFRMLLAEGFLLKGDPGNLVERVVDRDPKRRMPPDAKLAWTEAEARILRTFIEDVDQKNGR